MATTCAARCVCCWFWCCQAWLLLVLVLLGEDNKRKRALGREGSSKQRQVERTDLDDKRPVHLTRVRDPWDNTRREGSSMPLPSLLGCLPGSLFVRSTMPLTNKVHVQRVEHLDMSMCAL